MDKMCKYEVYHVTDKANTEKIIRDRFIYKPNDKHWLGDGIYFFIDKDLAKKWAEQDIKGYGDIENPSYIKCIIEISSEKVLDLRFLDDYNFIKDCFSEFMENIKGRVVFKNCNRFKFRALFFNYIKKKCEIQCIIAYFSERNKLSENTDYNKEFNNLKVPYIEVQMCLSRNKYIVHKEEMFL